MSPLRASFEDTEVLDHFLAEPASLRDNQSSPKLFSVRRTANHYSIFRTKYMEHDIVLGTDRTQYYARCKDNNGNWTPLLAASSANQLINSLLICQLNPDSKAMRNAK